MPKPPSSTMTLGDLPTAERVRVLCSDLYLAAFLITKGSRLHSLRFDDRSRATLVVTGSQALQHRQAFASGDVCLYLPHFRQSLNTLRDLLHELQTTYRPRNQIFLAPRLPSFSRE